MIGRNEINIEFDDYSKSYYATVIPPAAVGSGKTARKALSDLRKAAYYGIDTLINIKMVNVDSENTFNKED
jgi:hypothetical protein